MRDIRSRARAGDRESDTITRKDPGLKIDFTQETGELTPTLKLRRPQILQRFNDRLEEIYRARA